MKGTAYIHLPELRRTAVQQACPVYRIYRSVTSPSTWTTQEFARSSHQERRAQRRPVAQFFSSTSQLVGLDAWLRHGQSLFLMPRFASARRDGDVDSRRCMDDPILVGDDSPSLDDVERLVQRRRPATRYRHPAPSAEKAHLLRTIAPLRDSESPAPGQFCVRSSVASCLSGKVGHRFAKDHCMTIHVGFSRRGRHQRHRVKWRHHYATIE